MPDPEEKTTNDEGQKPEEGGEEKESGEEKKAAPEPWRDEIEKMIRDYNKFAEKST